MPCNGNFIILWHAEGKYISGVKPGGTLFPYIWCLLPKDNISALSHSATTYKTDMGNPYNISRIFLGEVVMLQRSGQKTATYEKRELLDSALQEYSSINKKCLIAYLVCSEVSVYFRASTM